MIACSMVALFFPHLFVTEDVSASELEHCITPKSYYHNPDIRIHICVDNGHKVYIYSKLQTFIFLVTIMAITFKTFISTPKVLSLVNLGFHCGLLAILMAFLYLFP
jgi:hypothetical protein